MLPRFLGLDVCGTPLIDSKIRSNRRWGLVLLPDFPIWFESLPRFSNTLFSSLSLQTLHRFPLSSPGLAFGTPQRGDAPAATAMVCALTDRPVRVCQVALLCIHTAVSVRPSMRECLAMLEGQLPVPPLPPRPATLYTGVAPTHSSPPP